MKKVTMSELAEKAGVSTASIRKFLRNEKVRNDIAEKIKLAIENTGFKIESKSTNCTKVVNEDMENKRIHAFLCNDLTQPKTRALYDAIVKVAHNRDELCIACDVGHNPMNEELYLKNITKIANDCIVASCISNSMVTEICHRTRCNYFTLQEDELLQCGIDDVSVGKIIGEHLIEKRKLVIRYLGYDEQQSSAHYEAIKNVYHNCKQPLDFKLKICDGTFEDAFIKLKDLLAEKIDLLILADDFMCLSLQKYMMDYRVYIPQNFELVTIGNKDRAHMCTLNQSVLAFDYELFAKDLLARISKEPIEQRDYLYWVQGGKR